MFLSIRLQSSIQNRRELDKAERALVAKRRDEDRQRCIAERIAVWRLTLLALVGPKPAGLLVWHFGAGWESRSVDDIPTSKIEEFVGKYA